MVKSAVKKTVIEQSKTKSEQNNTAPVLIRASDIQILRDSNGEDQVLGLGHFGVVKKAVWTCGKAPHHQKTVAVKFLHGQNGQDTQSLGSEIACMCGLDHDNLIKLFGIVLDFGPKDAIAMVTELAALGSLYSYLRKVRKRRNILPVKRLYSYVYQIAAGMEYLEGRCLIHRDLACRNILLASSDLVT